MAHIRPEFHIPLGATCSIMAWVLEEGGPLGSDLAKTLNCYGLLSISLSLATVSPTSFFYSNNRRQPALHAIEGLGHTLASWEPALSIIESCLNYFSWGAHQAAMTWTHVLSFLCLQTSKRDFFHPVTVKSLSLFLFFPLCWTHSPMPNFHT